MRITNDDVVRAFRHQQEKSIKACSEQAAAAVIRKMPKPLRRRISRAVLADIIALTFQKAGHHA